MQLLRHTSLALALLGLVCCTTPTTAHTRMYNPKPLFQPGFTKLTNYYGVIDSKQFTSKFGPVNNAEGAKYIATVMKAEGTPSLRQFIANHMTLLRMNDGGKAFTPTVECGMTITTGPRQPIPTTTGFPSLHTGPCEYWCDNTRILFNENCRANRIADKIPYDRAKCAGASVLQGMYVGVHLARWQVYTNCIPLVDGSETDINKIFKYREARDNDANDNDVANSTTVGPIPLTNVGNALDAFGDARNAADDDAQAPRAA